MWLLLNAISVLEYDLITEAIISPVVQTPKLTKTPNLTETLEQIVLPNLHQI